MSRDKREPRRDPNALHITNQFRADHGMVYELKCERDKLIIRVFERSSPADPADFRVEARGSDAAATAAVTEWGPTRLEALRSVGRAWNSLADRGELARFDWGDVAGVLHAVRAV